MLCAQWEDFRGCGFVGQAAWGEGGGGGRRGGGLEVGARGTCRKSLLLLPQMVSVGAEIVLITPHSILYVFRLLVQGLDSAGAFCESDWSET